MVEFLQADDIGEVKEFSDFVFSHEAIPEATDEITGYYLLGDVPVGLTVNSTGLISGRVEPFEGQPSCQDDIDEKEIPLFDGSNYNKIGRFRPDYYEFNFTINATWNETATPDTEETTTKRCSLKVKKDYGLDGEIFLHEWKKYHGHKG